MFTSATSFNGDISKWDVSRVNSMNNMFMSAKSFNSDISNWDVSSVSDMYGMFTGCLLYTSPSPRDLSTSRMPSSA